MDKVRRFSASNWSLRKRCQNTKTYSISETISFQNTVLIRANEQFTVCPLTWISIFMQSKTKDTCTHLFQLTTKQYFKASSPAGRLFTFFLPLYGLQHITKLNLKQNQLGLTSVTEVIHKNDFCYQTIWSAVDNTVYCSQEWSPAFIMKWDNYASIW